MLREIKNISKFFLLGFVLYTMISIPLPELTTKIIAQVEGKYGQQLDDAEQKYNTGNFDKAVEILTQVIAEKDITQDEKQRAYRLLGLTYIAKELEEDARSAVKKLLEMVPDYKTDPVQDPPPFIRLVQEVKKEEEQSVAAETPKEGGGIEWYWIAGGAAVAGVAAILIFSGGGNDNETVDPGAFPSPPVRPQ